MKGGRIFVSLKQLTEPFKYEKILTKSDLDKGSGKKKAKSDDMATTVKRIWGILTVLKRRFYFVLFLVVFSSLMALLGPILIGKIIDDYIVVRESEGLLVILVQLVFVYVAYSLSLWSQNYIMIGIAQQTIFHLRAMLFSHFHRLPISFFDKRQHGELMSRITNDIENVSSTLNSSVIQVLSSTLTIIGTVSVMLWLSPLLALITFLIVPIMVYGMKWITKRTSKLFQKQQQSLGEMNGVVEESISGQRIIKAFSQEQQVNSLFLGKAEKLKKTGFWAQLYSGLIPKVMNLLNNLSFAIIAGIGGLFALKGWVTIGVIVIFVEFSRQFTRPLNDLANQFNTLLSAVAGAERVFEIMDTEVEEHDEQKKLDLQNIKGHVQFEDVSFSYDDQDSTIKDVTFEVKPGEMIALIGPTGAGKTTIINLLSRFYDYSKGTIKIDGNILDKYKRESVRKHMSFVLQESFLFQGSILENIRYGRLDASDADVINAAKQANAHTFVERLPHGYNTIIQNSGVNLSQGQKQLLAIARAILADPTILILDEATSSIDTITELHIQQALKKLMDGRTSFVIAHRLNTIREADQIIVLQEGQIIERGSHSQLMNRKGFYYEIVESSLQ